MRTPQAAAGAPGPARSKGAVSTNPSVSMTSGGGGKRDSKHSHVDPMRSSKSHVTHGASPSETDRAFRENRPRDDRAAEDDGEEDDAAKAEWAAGKDAAGVNLPVLLNTASSIRGTEQLGARVEQVVRARLRHVAPHLTRVEVYPTDASRSGQGPAGLRCALDARPSNAKPVGADHAAATAEDAVRGVAAKLARLLQTQLGRRREVKGGGTIRSAG